VRRERIDHDEGQRRQQQSILSNGDTLTLSFNQCHDSSADTVNGGMIFTIGTLTSGWAATYSSAAASPSCA
jgi:hypothetical protein